MKWGLSQLRHGVVEWKDISPWRPEFGHEVKHFLLEIVFFLRMIIRSSKATIGGGGGAQRPVLRVNKPKKTGARNARARMRGK